MPTGSVRKAKMPISEVSGGNEMRLCLTLISGCMVIELPTSLDDRGSFVKNFHQDQFLNLGLETQFPEAFFTRSFKGVLRGIHFTVPPIDQVKVVTCVQGMVIDAVIDLRRGSPTYGKYELFELSAECPMSIYIGKGLGHGFYVPTEEAVLLYQVSTLYSAEYDRGIRWDSAGIEWPSSTPVVSDRDRSLPELGEFCSPFQFSEHPE